MYVNTTIELNVWSRGKFAERYKYRCVSHTVSLSSIMLRMQNLEQFGILFNI